MTFFVHLSDKGRIGSLGKYRQRGELNRTLQSINEGLRGMHISSCRLSNEARVWCINELLYAVNSSNLRLIETRHWIELNQFDSVIHFFVANQELLHI